MTSADADAFFEQLSQNNDIELCCDRFADKEDHIFDRHGKEKYTCYIRFKRFPFKPEFGLSADGKYYFTNKGENPLIEFSLNFSDKNPFCLPGRIYWHHDEHTVYDVQEFSRMYSECVRTIRKNAVFIDKTGGRNIYFHKNALDRIKNRKPNYWLDHGGLLAYNVGTSCRNNCISCKRAECEDITGTDQTDLILDEYKIKSTVGDTIVFGAFSEPFSPECEKLTLSVIRRLGRNDIVMITNGLSFPDVLDSIADRLSKIIIFKPSDDITEYLDITRSGYGKSAFGIIDRFIEKCSKLGINFELITGNRETAKKSVT